MRDTVLILSLASWRSCSGSADQLKQRKLRKQRKQRKLRKQRKQRKQRKLRKQRKQRKQRKLRKLRKQRKQRNYLPLGELVHSFNEFPDVVLFLLHAASADVAADSHGTLLRFEFTLLGRVLHMLFRPWRLPQHFKVFAPRSIDEAEYLR